MVLRERTLWSVAVAQVVLVCAHLPGSRTVKTCIAHANNFIANKVMAQKEDIDTDRTESPSPLTPYACWQ